MACTPAITIDVQIVSTATGANYSLEPGSQNGPITVQSNGSLDLSGVAKCVNVTMKMNSGYTFFIKYKAGTGTLIKDSLSFAMNQGATKKPVLKNNNDHEFPHLPIDHSGGPGVINFDYRNTDDCGVNKKSQYGIYVANASGAFLEELDPIVSNGGNESFHCHYTHRSGHHLK